ncbi:MAG: hypothetical protein WC406_07925 [Methanoregula sp.]
MPDITYNFDINTCIFEEIEFTSPWQNPRDEYLFRVARDQDMTRWEDRLPVCTLQAGDHFSAYPCRFPL